MIEQPSGTGEMRTQPTEVSISMLTSFVPDFVRQPEVWAVPYSTTGQATLNREISRRK